MVRFAVVFVALGALGAAVPSPAAAAGKWKLLEPATSPVSADGVRYAAWSSGDGSTVLYDDRDRSTRRIETPAGMTLIGTGGGVLAWQQAAAAPNGTFPAVTVLDLASGATVAGAQPSSSDHCGPESAIRYSGLVGSQGLSATCTFRYTSSFSVNWRSGAQRAMGGVGIDDLNNPELSTPVCKPFKRVGTPVQLGNTDSLLVPMWQHGNFNLTYTAASVRASEAGLWRSLRLRRCGHRSSRVLHGGRKQYVYSASLGPAHASWLRLKRRSGGWSVRAASYDLKTRKTKTWRAIRAVPTISGAARQPTLATVRHAVFLSTPAPGARTFQIRIGRR